MEFENIKILKTFDIKSIPDLDVAVLGALELFQTEKPMAIGYCVIAQIQKQHPPYFKENINAYAEKTSEIFGQTIASRRNNYL